jgi:hypothetical protein
MRFACEKFCPWIIQQYVRESRSRLLETNQCVCQRILLYLHKQISGDGFRDLYAPAEKRLNQLLGEQPKLEAEVAYLKINDMSGEEVLAEAKTLYERWPKLAPDEKRKIAQAIMEKIVVGDGEINLTLSYMPTSEELCKSQQQMAPATSMRRPSCQNKLAHSFWFGRRIVGKAGVDLASIRTRSRERFTIGSDVLAGGV